MYIAYACSVVFQQLVSAVKIGEAIETLLRPFAL